MLNRLALTTIAILLAGHGGTLAWAARKSHHAPTVITSPQEAAPDTTATIAARALPPQDIDKDDGPLPPPFHFPTATRTRMRECGEKWQAMKMAGEAGEEIWRSFATHCLAAANGPSDKH